MFDITYDVEGIAYQKHRHKGLLTSYGQYWQV